MKIKVYHNGDAVFIAWKPGGFIPGCGGSALLLRRRNGVEEIVSTWVGFVDQDYRAGKRRSSCVHRGDTRHRIAGGALHISHSPVMQRP